mmetsp:Transcript_17189/g.36405  ORF Transcript_17189/g.36405 Transcript_17189/m.36405 type:complete len:299 (-) Transcript_17189:158-1054(-)
MSKDVDAIGRLSFASKPHEPPPFVLLREAIAGGASTAAVSALLNPIDVLKTRRQLEAHSRTRAMALAAELWSEGGLVGLYRPGLAATVGRELVYSGCAKGLYPTARALISGNAEPTLPQRVAAASATGFGGSVCANALDVVKIRQFAHPARYPSFVGAMRALVASEGVLSPFVRGVSASAPRGAAIAVGEVSTYDATKAALKRAGYTDGFNLHVVTSLLTGVVATTVAAPFDLLKSRVMASEHAGDNLCSVLLRLCRREGVLALFNGWAPTYLRLGPHAVLTFPLFEASRKILGLEYV